MRGTAKRPRLTVFRSNKAIYAQIIDDEKGKTLVAASKRELESNKKPAIAIPKESRVASKAQKEQKRKTFASSKNFASLRLQGKYSKTERARLVGELLAKKALKKGIKAVVFDRRKYKYHGRVKALAEGARKGGLDF